MDPKEKLIIALDVDTKEKALSLVDTLKGDVKYFKIGLELFASCGPSIIRDISRTGCQIFLDLKLHDIPNTVSKAAINVTSPGIFMLNVHALGGYEMMKKAADSVRQEADRTKIAHPKIIAVTILTSMDEMTLKKAGISDTMDSEVLRLAGLAKEAGLDGVVASPLEVKLLRKTFGNTFLIVTPGVRPKWAASGDQKRIATPAEAIACGASYIVVGRPVTEAADRKEAVRKILEEMKT
ncbi:MAG: orotidine-5'-phosphate decarboxylase [Candidatus Omnitrophica bacterium]|nr:orotidine-5'-phosphate decarboxylase [Candidatus Omnitrophota bacterium]MBU0881150.1 orotidine-5'-phosphate decarboxylase [Candidatus Omnitrophota bacterium]MBU0895701.1 orotidine-5'-phosphate decarboxylase [Candidatus Omnitrophota bacterium]MBU1808977.1 orotidine-5'-phosphate decarboxylase [Candidatus Omnitrophota bacterium]